MDIQGAKSITAIAGLVVLGVVALMTSCTNALPVAGIVGIVAGLGGYAVAGGGLAQN